MSLVLNQTNKSLVEFDYFPHSDLQILADLSGNGYHGQLGSTVGVDTNDPAWNGKGLVFGGDDYIKIPHNQTLNVLPLTVNFVIEASTIGLYPIICNYVVSSLNGWYFFMNGSGRLGGYYCNGGSSYIIDDADNVSPLITIGSPVMGSIIVDKDGMHKFINGEWKTSQPWNGTPSAPTNNTFVSMGSYQGYDAYFIGNQYYTMIDNKLRDIDKDYRFIRRKLGRRGVVLP